MTAFIEEVAAEIRGVDRRLGDDGLMGVSR
jgi:hypothetical protein